jgi:GNAT superfamily N-acetyltransferase
MVGANDLRRMSPADLSEVVVMVGRATADLIRREGLDDPPPGDRGREGMAAAIRHLVGTDPDGCWVLERGGRIVGAAAAIRRGSCWGLALLFVLPETQGEGVGRALLARAVEYGEGCSRRMISSSEDPSAIRSYAAVGLEPHPAMQAKGRVDPSRLGPVSEAVLPGFADDLPLIDEVDAGLRGGSRRVDVEFLLARGAELKVLDDGQDRGYFVAAPGPPLLGGHPLLLGATSEPAAAELLRSALHSAAEPVHLYCLTARQGWAMGVALEAALPLSPGPPLFVSPGLEPPAPWLLSGLFF